MPFQNIIKKASNYLLRSTNGQVEPAFNEGEVVFLRDKSADCCLPNFKSIEEATILKVKVQPLKWLLKGVSTFGFFKSTTIKRSKNNVCVHPPALLRQASDVVHHPGYLTVSCQLSGPHHDTPTLHLSWIPNSTLRKHPGVIRSRSRDEKNDLSSYDSSHGPCSDKETCQKCSTDERLQAAAYRTTYLEFRRRSSGGESLDSSRSISSTGPGQPTGDHTPSETVNEENSQECRDIPPSLDEAIGSLSLTPTSSTSASPLPSPAVNRPQINRIRYDPSADREFRGDETMICIVENEVPVDGSTDFNDRDHRSLSTSSFSLLLPNQAQLVGAEDLPSWLSSPELLALRHNLTFPESVTASPVVRKAQQCRRFSVDLGQMRSLRLFFIDKECTSGQLVVASRESQYKILHFHRGGLDRLASVLNEWSFLLHSKQQTGSSDALPYRHFMVCRPEVSLDELHPEEGTIGIVDLDVWIQVLNPDGQVEDDLTLRKGIFFGGLDSSLRSVVWPFLLRCYSFQSTYDERETQQALLIQEYQDIGRRRMELTGSELSEFTRNVLCVVEKDVVRTDRGNPYFAGQDNPNIEVMKNILVNYAFYNSGCGYSQGMSDLLAPVLAEIKNEAISFWCFVGLMQRASFVCTPTDGNMDRSLTYLRELLRVMLPQFYAHLERYTDAMELLFCHRWILLCFKREFPEAVALSIWEACWANYLTDYFHLFLCLSIISVYADDVIAQDLHTDEMLLHFSSLAMYMDGQLILRKARGLLQQFRQMPQIPCTLAGLCRLCGPGMWDSAHNPVVVCSGKDCVDSPCPYNTPQE